MKLTRERRASKPFTCSIITLVVEINDHRYSADQIDAGEFGTKAFRLTKHSARDGGAVYDVAMTMHGPQCDCADFEMRRRGLDASGCKHIKALTQLGLMPAPVSSMVVESPADSSPILAAVPCCPADELEPCVACVEAPPAPAGLPGEMVDPGDAEGDPELWPDGWDDHIWNLGPDPAPEPDGPAPEPDPLDVEDPPVDLPGIGETFREIPEALAPVDPWGVESPAETWGPETDVPALEVLDDDGPTVEGARSRSKMILDLNLEVLDDDGPTVEDLEDYREWSREVDARGHLDHSERLTLEELAERQAAFYRGWKTPAGEMFARAMDTLAFQIRLTSSATPDELEARKEALEADARDTWEAIGFEQGRMSCQCHDYADHTFGHGA